jgi:hypothetical protein
MAGLRDDAQWIVLMGFIVSFSLFFLAVVINQSTVIGQTTAESVSEFPKNDIRGAREVIIQDAFLDNTGANSDKDNVANDIRTLALSRQNTVLDFRNTSSSTSTETFTIGEIRFNNGVTIYRETWTYRE